MVNSRAFVAEVMHHRLAPVVHRFRYPTYVYALDLDELEVLTQRHRWLSHNRCNWLSLWDRDYLDDRAQPLREKLQEYLTRHGLQQSPAQVWLLTTPRLLGYCFNPVNFWLCCDRQGKIFCTVAEVNNTFGERHLYLLDQSLPCRDGFAVRYRVPKAFYVSPFNAIEGDYEFRLAPLSDRLDIRLRVYRDDRLWLNTWLRGRARPIDLAGSLGWAASAWLTMARIHWQAARLFFQKHLPIVYKPRPTHPWTVRAEPPTPLHRWALEKFLRDLSQVKQGQLLLDLPNRQVRQLGNPDSSQAHLRILNWDFFLRWRWQGSKALTQGLIAREWESPNPVAVQRFFQQNR